MNKVNTTALLERVKRLERQNKRIKLTGIVVVLGMAFVLLVGARKKVQKEIVAESFRVVDTQGRTRAGFSANQYSSELTFYGENEKLRVVLSAGFSANQPGSGLTLFDRKGEPRAFLDPSSLTIRDKKGKRRVVLGTVGEKRPHGIGSSFEGTGLGLYDEKGEARAVLSVRLKGPRLVLFDKGGEPRAGLSVRPGGPMLVLSSELGKPRAVLYSLREGSTWTFTNERGSPRVGFRINKGGPVLGLYGIRGKREFSAP